ncbi:uncharacterized protein LOC129940111 [Eupeodes corollae]|uniref:uncharacterized protein LOC129940111 n=1 Tax=Eupeodes corollae TaxID=290404 RepID=UPI0024916A0B|nr:uncharacterized protein LOC129940111 [Eupeodes corollae]
MPKKKLKSIDSRKTIPAEEDGYKLITIQENHVYQIKHENLIQRIWNSTMEIADIELKVKEIEKNENLIKEWQEYLSCDKIPKPFDPPSIRSFFEKSHLLEKEDIENTINWILGIDECSILNQDIDSQNMTKIFLKDYRIDFGVQYDNRICDIMELLKRIETFLKISNKEVSTKVLRDIEELNQFAQNKICNYIDHLTYRVLSSEVAYMEPIDATTAEYSFSGQHFDMHLWTFQNVPLYLDPEELKSKPIEFQQIKTNLNVPFSVLLENMVLRGLHYHFDHFSSRSRSYELPTELMNNQIEKNLKICLRKEWASYLKIQADVKTKMIKERADFDEAVRIKAEQDELRAKENKNSDDLAQTIKPKKKKKKDGSANVIKLPKEPPIVTPHQVPIVREDFLEQDSADYMKAILEYHPNKLKLSKGELNLRQYQILGGVYQINSLSKPSITNFPRLIMTWYQTDKNIEQKPTEIKSDDFESDNISKFFEISFKLPDYICHWDDPITCLFEDNRTPIEDVNLFETKKGLEIRSPIIINDFNLHGLFTKPMMYDFIQNVIPRVISSFNFPEDYLDEIVDDKNKAALGRPKTTAEEEETNKEIEMQRQLLSFDHQNNPERLFPLFKNVLPVVVLPINGSREKLGTHPYEYFSEFLSALESIKNSYRKSTFKDRFGKPVKIVAEEYEKNIRRPTLTTKLVGYGETEKRKSSTRTSLLKNRRSSVLSKQSIGTVSLSLKHHHDNGYQKDDSQPKHSTAGIDDNGIEEKSSFSKWSTENVLKSVFNANEKKLTIWTDRLGTFGFAFNRYHHFPFKNWILQPSEENANELELQIESTYALFSIYISKIGYRAFVSDFSKTQKTRKIFLDMKEPVIELRSFKKEIQEKYLNIFPEPDALWYVNGDFSEKHLAAELHTYDCMSLNSFKIKYHNSNWNKLSNRRTMVLAIGELKELVTDLSLIKITPEDALFVEIKENTNNAMELEFISTWRNLEWYVDLNQLIKASFADTNESLSEDQNIVTYNLRNLLHSLRLLSFS